MDEQLIDFRDHHLKKRELIARYRKTGDVFLPAVIATFVIFIVSRLFGEEYLSSLDRNTVDIISLTIMLGGICFSYYAIKRHRRLLDVGQPDIELFELAMAINSYENDDWEGIGEHLSTLSNWNNNGGFEYLSSYEHRILEEYLYKLEDSTQDDEIRKAFPTVAKELIDGIESRQGLDDFVEEIEVDYGPNVSTWSIFIEMLEGLNLDRYTAISLLVALGGVILVLLDYAKVGAAMTTFVVVFQIWESRKE